MNTEELQTAFEKHRDGIFNRDVSNKLSSRPDLHAFLLLDKISLRSKDDDRDCEMIAAAEHDEIWLYPEPALIAAVITEDEVRELAACGVAFFDDGLGFRLNV